MKKVLFIGPSTEEQDLVQQAALAQAVSPDIQMHTTASFGQEALWWAQNPIDLLVLRLPDDDGLQAFFLTKLRNDIPKSLPIILMAETVSQDLLQITPYFQKIRIVKAPVAGAFLLKCIMDMTTDWEKGKRQVHPRYITEQSILISQLGDAQKVPGLMRNLSVSGAYFETQQAKVDFQVNAMVKIEIHTSDQNKYEFDAKIVWVRGHEDGVTKGYGCAFVDADEIYENLMKGFGT